MKKLNFVIMGLVILASALMVVGVTIITMFTIANSSYWFINTAVYLFEIVSVGVAILFINNVAKEL